MDSSFTRLFAVPILPFVLFSCEVLGDFPQSQATLSIQVPAGRIECFYHSGRPNVPFEIEYQVISGGDLDINFSVRDPNGAIVVADKRRGDALHRFDGKVAGEYQICFDNSFSTFQPKLVFFEVFEDVQEIHTEEFQKLGQVHVGTPIETFGIKVEDIHQLLGRVHLNLEKAIKSQTVVRHFEAVDRIILENNSSRVNFYSIVQTVVMVLVGIVQVVMVRSLFEERSKLGRALRGKGGPRSMT